MIDALRILKQPNVLKLFIAYLITHLGTAMAPIAMAFGVLELTGSAHDTSFVMAASILAAVVMLFIGGAVADRTSRKNVIFYSELFAFAVQGVVAFLFLTHQATILSLAALMFLNGIAMAFNAPAAVGLVPLLVKEKDLQSVNALLGMAKNGAMIGGAAIAGILVALLGAGITILIDACSFLLSALLIATLSPAAQTRVESHSFIQDLKNGWQEFIAHTWVWTIVLQFAFIVAAFQAIQVVVGPAVSLEFYGGAKAWGWVMSGFSAGLLLGGFVGMKITPRYPMRFASFCVFAGALIPTGIAFLVPLPILISLAIASGFFWEMFVILWVSALQKNIPPKALSRVSAYDYIGSIGLAPIGIVVAGYLYDSIGYQVVALASAAIIIFATAAVLCVKDVWSVRFE